MGFEFHYKPDGLVLKDFMRSNKFFRGIRGHVGSGKSVACAIEVFRRAMEQEAHPKTKIRQTRWAVVRNTNPQLKTTTIKTWLEWFPEDVFGKFNWSPPYTHMIRMPLSDGTTVECEVIFLALDTEADIRKLLSLELTGVWVNEAREVSKAIVDGCTSRVRRFPSQKDSGPGPTWSGVIADTNPPSDDHWWAIMSGDVPPPDHLSAADLLTYQTPANWEFFTQPPAMLEQWSGGATPELTGYKMNPDRENRHFLKDIYYEDMLSGKTKEWINVYVLNKYGAIFEGTPVYPDFSRSLHVAKNRLQALPGHTIYVGLDFGLTPAATFGQRIRGRWIVLREKVATNMGMTRFAPELKRFMLEEFGPDADYLVTGDPAGDQRVQTDETTPFQILRANGIMARPASTNDPELRIGAVETQLVGLVDGAPRYLISPCCTKLIQGKEGGYHYKVLRDRMEKDRPEKNHYSHVADAEQYMMDGAGETRGIVKSKHMSHRATVANHAFSPQSSSMNARVRFKPRSSIRH